MRIMQVSYKIAHAVDAHYFENVQPGLFDRLIEPRLLREFLTDSRHHIAIALVEGSIVGFVSALDYVHPDKPKELWINEVGVAAAWRNQGIAKALMRLMLEHAKDQDCAEAWVLTQPENSPANALYASLGGLTKGEKTPSIMFSFNCE